jgi:GNAT superfamily N-acetyltransferase
MPGGDQGPGVERAGPTDLDGDLFVRRDFRRGGVGRQLLTPALLAPTHAE